MPGLTGTPVVRPAKVPAAWPKTIADAKAEKEVATRPAAAWSQDEIDQEKAHCARILKQTDAVVIPEAPIREGECGAAAPVQLISVGRNPQVALSPPVTVTCYLAANVDTWVKRKLQPIARRHLGQPVIKIETMSSYSCRNAYGRAKAKLSEHAKANAIDIRGFTTQAGANANVLAGWGMTGREIRARVAAAKAAQDKVEAQNAAQKKNQPVMQANAARETAPAPSPAPTPTAAAPSVAAASMIAFPSIGAVLPGAESSASTGFGMVGEPQKLGGPKPVRNAKGPEIPFDGEAAIPAKTSLFLRAAHDSACDIFGTTLGPEANRAHRNHLHIDMAQRTANLKICR